MELFGARSEAPIEVCLEEVRKSDVLIVIVGHRYGSTVPGRNLSFTETEYNDGYSHGKSSFVYMRDETVPILPDYVEQDATKLSRLKAFRDKLQERHTVYKFRSPSELALQVTVDLNRSMLRVDNMESALGIIRRGVDAWNTWKAAHRGGEPEMSGVDLSGLSLEAVDFSNMVMRGSKFCTAELALSNFSYSDLRDTNFSGAKMRLAQLDHSDLSNSDLRRTDLREATLIATKLTDALVIDADLSEVNLSKAELSRTVIVRSDLRNAKGLKECVNLGSCSFDVATALKGNLQTTVLDGLGISELPAIAALEAVPSVEFYSCFISYSAKDQAFADRLYADLQSNGVRCWFAPHDIRGGRKIHEQIDEAIRVHDKLLLILSEHSMASDWVGTEIANARERESREKKQMLFPITIAPFEEVKNWKQMDGDSGADVAKKVREYYIPDFSSWEKDHAAYQREFEKLVAALKAVASG
jgi:uncharacterized protein YjbI with pentapeptide repeats